MENPEKIKMSDLKPGDKFIIPSVGGLNTFIKQSDYHGFTEFHYKNSSGVKTASVGNCTVYKVNNDNNK